MINFIKKNIFVIAIFTVTLFVGFLTFLTFIDKSFIQLNNQNLQYLLLTNIFLLIFFFFSIYSEIKKSIKNDIDVEGSKSNKKYINPNVPIIKKYIIVLVLNYCKKKLLIKSTYE